MNLIFLFSFQFVRVNSNKSSVALVIVLLCFFLLVLGMGLFGGIAYYKRKKGPAGWTKSSTNENYMDSVNNISSFSEQQHLIEPQMQLDGALDACILWINILYF